MTKLFFVFGILFLATGLGKTYLLLTNPFADIHSGFPKWILWGGVVLEMSVVYLLVATKSNPLKWFSTFSLVSIFAIVSSIRFALGYQSCGCAGVFEMPTWVSLAVNYTSILALLWIARRNGWTLRELIRQLKTDLSMISQAGYGSIIAWALFAFVLLSMQVPLVKAAIDKSVFGLDVVATPVVLGDLSLGEFSLATVTLHNLSDGAIEIIGVRSSCTCVGFENTRRSIPAHSSAEIEVKVFPKSTGSFRHRLVCFLGGGTNQSSVSVDLAASVNSFRLDRASKN